MVYTTSGITSSGIRYGKRHKPKVTGGLGINVKPPKPLKVPKPKKVKIPPNYKKLSKEYKDRSSYLKSKAKYRKTKQRTLKTLHPVQYKIARVAPLKKKALRKGMLFGKSGHRTIRGLTSYQL
jgi:hypothetical protein